MNENLRLVAESSVPDWQRKGMEHIWMPYTQMHTAPLPCPVVATEDVYLILANGERLIDGLASWWTACHGYNHPYIRECVQSQLNRMPHVMFGGIVHQPALTLATHLARLLPGDLNRVFFTDSGSVSVEVAMKMAVQFWLNKEIRHRTKFVCFRHAYHGDTTGAMSVCDPVNSMHSHFKGFLLEQYPLEIPRNVTEAQVFEQFLASNADEVAGVIIEPLVQGAGGMKFHSPESLALIHAACERQNVLLIADELATGFGRTGTMFACEQAGIVPDIICLGKALTGGTVGLAATVATDRIFAAFLSEDASHSLMHGPTYMANPLACAAANASLDLFESEPRLEQVHRIEQWLQQALEPCSRLKGVVDVRCKGAIGVVQVDELHHLDQLRSRFVQEGVWLRPFSDMIYVTPAFTMTDQQLQTLSEAIVNVLTEWSRW